MSPPSEWYGIGQWHDFYVIVGSAAGGLTGLQFVAMALVGDMPLTPDEKDAGSAFSTPSIVHLAMALLLAALMVVPWAAMVCWGVTGLGGAIYAAVVAGRMRRQTGYKPVAEDWIFRAVLPLAVNACLMVAACVGMMYPAGAFFLVAVCDLALLFLGIHAAWDNMMYLVFVKRHGARHK